MSQPKSRKLQQLRFEEPKLREEESNCTLQRLNRQGSEPSSHRPQSRGGQRRTSSRWVSEDHAQIRLRLKQSDPRRRVKCHAPPVVSFVRCQRHQANYSIYPHMFSRGSSHHIKGSQRVTQNIRSPLSSLSDPLKWSGILSKAEIPFRYFGFGYLCFLRFSLCHFFVFFDKNYRNFW